MAPFRVPDTTVSSASPAPAAADGRALGSGSPAPAAPGVGVATIGADWARFPPANPFPCDNTLCSKIRAEGAEWTC